MINSPSKVSDDPGKRYGFHHLHRMYKLAPNCSEPWVVIEAVGNTVSDGMFCTVCVTNRCSSSVGCPLVDPVADAEFYIAGPMFEALQQQPRVRQSLL